MMIDMQKRYVFGLFAQNKENCIQIVEQFQYEVDVRQIRLQHGQITCRIIGALTHKTETFVREKYQPRDLFRRHFSRNSGTNKRNKYYFLLCFLLAYFDIAIWEMVGGTHSLSKIIPSSLLFAGYCKR